MVSAEEFSIPVGEGSVSALYTRPDQPAATLVVAHGAGAGMEHPFMAGFADGLATDGVACLRFNFPYREAGRKFPDRPPAAIAAWRTVMDFGVELAADRGDAGQLWAGGKSFGGRMASMAVAEGMPAAGLVYLGYPLHPPGKPEKLRDEHLYGVQVPMLFLQGSRDTFVTPELLTGVVERIGPHAVLEWVAGGDHSFAVAGQKRPPFDVGLAAAARVSRYVLAQTISLGRAEA